MRSVVCPVSCGRCCGDCPDLGEKGCRFPRDKRPPACLSFTCDVADLVLAGKLKIGPALEELPRRWGK